MRKLLGGIDLADVMGAAGLLLLAAGLAAYDWRVAAVVVGVVLLGLAVGAAWRAGG